MKKIFILLSAAFSVLTAFGQQGHAQLSGAIDFLQNGDLVILTRYQYGGFYNYPPFIKTDTVIAKNHAFNFDIICSEKPQYIKLDFLGKRIVTFTDYIVTSGDRIDIRSVNGAFYISGAASSAFKVQYELRKLEVELDKAQQWPFSPSTLQVNFTLFDKSRKELLARLEENRDSLTPGFYSLLKLDIISNYEYFKNYYVYSNWSQYKDSAVNPYRQTLPNYKKSLGTSPRGIATDTASAFYSAHFSEFILEKYAVDSCLLPGKNFSVHQCYLFLSSHYKGLLREKLLISLFLRSAHSGEDFAADMQASRSFFSNLDFRNVLLKLIQSTAAGEAAYNFELKDENNKIVRLSDFHGKVVVLDFWFNGCPACRTLAPKMFSLEKKFENDQVVFISISIDKVRTKWLQGLKSGEYASGSSVNLNIGVAGWEDPAAQNFQVIGYPTVVVIDKNGRLGQSPGFPNMDKAKRLDDLITRYLGE